MMEWPWPMALGIILASSSTLILTTNSKRNRRKSHPSMANSGVQEPQSTPPHSSLEIIGGGCESFLSAFKTLNRPYNPFPLICLNQHVETIFAAMFRSLPRGVRFRRVCLITADSGSVALDWVAGDDAVIPADSPVLILLPGLTGGSDDSYVQHMLVRAGRDKWRVVVFNSRGCGNSPVTTPQFYSASFTEDLREVVNHVKTYYPTSNLYAAGWSLGANILVRYLGEESDNCSLSGAVSLCNPFNPVLANENLRKGFNNIYEKVLAGTMRNFFKRHAHLFEDMGGDYNMQLVANPKSVRDFDDGLTRVSFGFKSVDDYYSNSSSSDFVKLVCRPLLCIQAANDPIAPDRAIPRDDIKENQNCLLIVTPKGGHLGWVAGDDTPIGAPWTDTLVMDFLNHLEKGKTEEAFQSSSDLVGNMSRQKEFHPSEV